MQNRNRAAALRTVILIAILTACARTGEQPGAPPAAASGRQTIRIMAYNIRHGLGMDNRVDLQRISSVINRLQPDLVTLQEVDNGVERTNGEDQAARLGELTEMQAVFGSFMDYQGGQYGMAILSKHPIAGSVNHRLPPGEEPRSALAARILLDDSGRAVVLVGIHFYRTATERLAQARQLLQVLAEERAPVILAGDFNSTPDSDVIQLFDGSWSRPDKGQDRYTFSSMAPDREIDFILYRPAAEFRVIESRVIHEPLASDHRPVLLVLEIN